MKIGVITFHRAINYGAVLQTYALQRKLLSMGRNVEVIDYRCKHMEELYKVGKFKGKSLKQIVRESLNFFAAHKKKKNFERFICERIKMSDKVYNRNTIQEDVLDYDIFITGSDQVFNFACSDFDKAYFLDFVPDRDKKFSYAASFGMRQVPGKYEAEYARLLSDFKELSIRETTGQQIVKNLIDKETELSIDPVFLLNKGEWDRIAKRPKISNYVLIYKLNSSDLIYDFARKLAKKEGKKLLAMNFDLVDQIKNIGIKGLTSASIEEFIGYFKYADYIVTNSFHGTAFSIIFHKKFYVEPLQKDFKPNDRVETLLRLTGLDSCRIMTIQDCKLNVERNFADADKMIDNERKHAEAYLERITNGAVG